MNEAIRRSDLSSLRQDLVDLMRRIHFGRIENLSIRHGEPVLSPAPQVVYEVKLGPRGTYPKGSTDDFVLKSQLLHLFEYFDRLGHGTITGRAPGVLKTRNYRKEKEQCYQPQRPHPRRIWQI